MDNSWSDRLEGKSGALVRNKGYKTSSHLLMYDDIIIQDEE